MVNTGLFIDIQKLLSEVKLSTTGIPGELKYNWAGPGTNISLRTNPDNTPKDWSIPINEIDEACYYHDLGYDSAINSGKSSDEILKLKHIEDEKFFERFKNIQPRGLMERICKFFIIKTINAKLRFGMGGLHPSASA